MSIIETIKGHYARYKAAEAAQEEVRYKFLWTIDKELSQQWDVSVIVDDRAILAVIGCIPTYPVAFVSLKGLHNSAVFLPESYKSWDPEHIQAVVAHEKGHVVHFHKPKTWKNNLRALGFTMPEILKQELQADAYAAKRGFGKPMKEVLELHAQAHPNIKEFQTRIAALS
jgi:Zn-dependent protease with chaperone function